jgi:hypothetical protein
MVAVRFLSLGFVSLALMALGADLLAWIETDTYDPHTFLSLLSAINERSAEGIQAWANGLPGPVSGGVNAFLQAWGFVALGLPGVLLAVLGVRK